MSSLGVAGAFTVLSDIGAFEPSLTSIVHVNSNLRKSVILIC